MTVDVDELRELLAEAQGHDSKLPYALCTCTPCNALSQAIMEALPSLLDQVEDEKALRELAYAEAKASRDHVLTMAQQRTQATIERDETRSKADALQHWVSHEGARAITDGDEARKRVGELDAEVYRRGARQASLAAEVSELEDKLHASRTLAGNAVSECQLLSRKRDALSAEVERLRESLSDQEKEIRRLEELVCDACDDVHCGRCDRVRSKA